VRVEPTRALDPGQLDLRCPGPGPCRGIVGGEFTDDGVVVDAREALNQVETGPGPAGWTLPTLPAVILI